MDIVDRITQLRQGLISASASDAEHIWHETQAIVGEIERSSHASKNEVQTAEKLKGDISTFLMNLQDGAISPDSSAAGASLTYLQSCIERRSFGVDGYPRR